MSLKFKIFSCFKMKSIKKLPIKQIHYEKDKFMALIK